MINVYRSTNYNAPALSGTAGALIAILDACLVNGFGGQTPTSITRAGSVATMTLPNAHGIIGTSKMLIAGANQAEYNGTFTVTPTGTNTVTFTVSGTPVTPATGTITANFPGAGWTKPFNGANLAAYLQGGADAKYYRVNDTGTTNARIVGYGSMSDVNTGTADFPTAAQVSGGLYIAKSSVASAAVRPWTLIASNNHFVFLADTANDQVSILGNYFGKINNYKSADVLSDVAISSAAPDTSTLQTFTTGFTTSQQGVYFAASHTGIGSAVAGSLVCSSPFATITTAGSIATLPYPTLDGGLLMSPFIVHEPNQGLRGELRGLHCPLHQRPITHLDTFNGSGVYAGKQFQAIRCTSSGEYMIEISDTY